MGWHGPHDLHVGTETSCVGQGHLWLFTCAGAMLRGQFATLWCQRFNALMSACNALVLECSAPVSACNALLPVCNALVSVCNAPALECNALGSIWDALVPASDACALLCNAPVPARDAPLCKAHLVCNALVLSCVTLLAWRQMCSSLVQMCNAPVLENRCSTHAGSAQRRRATMCNAPKLVCDCSSTGVQCSVLLCNAQCCCAMLGAAVQCSVLLCNAW